jgi:hypothetical protein
MTELAPITSAASAVATTSSSRVGPAVLGQPRRSSSAQSPARPASIAVERRDQSTMRTARLCAAAEGDNGE